MYEKKLKTAILLVLMVSSISCTRTIPVRLELPNQPIYNDGISNGLKPILDRGGNVMYYNATVESIQLIGENKALCREYSDTLRKIILTTY